MEDIIRLILAILTIVFAGWNILRLIGFRRSGELALCEKLAASYGLGIGAISLEMLIFYFIKIPYNIGVIVGPWLALFIMNAFLVSPPFAAPPKKPADAYGEDALFVKFLWFGIALEVIYAFFRALIKPMESYDAVAIYAMKSKMIYDAGGLTTGLFADLLRQFPHPDYPLNIPLAETFVYLFLGGLNDQLVKIIFPLFFLAALILVYFAIKRFAAKKVALLFTFFLAAVPQFNNYATNGYLDLPLAYYVFLSLIFLSRWKDDRKDLRLLVVSAVSCAFAGWTKNEGLMYCGINILLLSIMLIRGKERRALSKAVPAFVIYLCIIIAVSAPWALIKNRFGFVNDEVSIGQLKPSIVLRNYERIWPIVYEFQKQVLGPKKWNMIWILFAAALLLRAGRAFSRSGRIALLTLFLALGGYTLVYMITARDVGWHASSTASRFLIHIVPIAVLWLAYIYKEETAS